MNTKQNYVDLEASALHEIRRAGLSTNDIAVTADGGVVTLSGFVDDYSDKVLAENAVKLIRGVRGIASEIKVRGSVERTDPEIVKDAVDALKKDVRVPDSQIKVMVRDGWLTLEGRVESHHQKDAAEEAVKYIGSVRGIANHIAINPISHH
ncbi:MAG TPA: BON domain-containing protein [Blastocatellia bacterium]|nr:BON domain-containing protein [Blastocatellia bacterium]